MAETILVNCSTAIHLSLICFKIFSHLTNSVTHITTLFLNHLLILTYLLVESDLRSCEVT